MQNVSFLYTSTPQHKTGGKRVAQQRINWTASVLLDKCIIYLQPIDPFQGRQFQQPTWEGSGHLGELIRPSQGHTQKQRTLYAHIHIYDELRVNYCWGPNLLASCCEAGELTAFLDKGKVKSIQWREMWKDNEGITPLYWVNLHWNNLS